MVDAISTYPLDNSPRLPTLHQLGDCHIFAVDTAEHKGKFGRVDAETADVGDYTLVFSPLAMKYYLVANFCSLQRFITVHSDWERDLRHTPLFRGRVLYLYRSGHGVSVCLFSIQVEQVGHMTRQSTFVIVVLKPPHISSARISSRYHLASVVSNLNSHSQIGHFALYRLMFGSFLTYSILVSH